MGTGNIRETNVTKMLTHLRITELDKVKGTTKDVSAHSIKMARRYETFVKRNRRIPIGTQTGPLAFSRYIHTVNAVAKIQNVKQACEVFNFSALRIKDIVRLATVVPAEKLETVRLANRDRIKGHSFAKVELAATCYETYGLAIGDYVFDKIMNSGVSVAATKAIAEREAYFAKGRGLGDSGNSGNMYEQD